MGLRASRAARGALAVTMSLLLVLGSGCQSTAPTLRTFYVDAENGSDAATGRSPDEAWETATRVAEVQLLPGDQVLLRRGTELVGPFKIEDSGSPAAPLRVSSYGEGTAPSISGGQSCVSVTGDYVEIDGFRAEACDWAGFLIAGSHVTLKNSIATGNAAGVVIAESSNGAKVVANVLKDNNVMSINTPDIEDDDSGAFGVLLNGTRAEVTDNFISGHYADSYDYGTDGSAVEIFNSDGNRILRNIAVDNDTFVEAGGALSRDNTIAYNSAVSSLPDTHALVTRGGEDETFGPVENTVADNNTFLLTGRGSQAVTCDGACSEEILTLRNNVVVAEGLALWTDGPFVDEANIFWSGGRRAVVRGGRVGSPMLGQGSSTKDPMLRPDGEGLVMLAVASPARSAGRNLGYQTDVRGRPILKRNVDLGAVQS